MAVPDNEACTDALQTALLAVAYWSSGVAVLNQTGALQICASHLTRQWHSPNRDTMVLRRLMSQILSHCPGGWTQLEQTGLVAIVIQEFDSFVGSQASGAQPGDHLVDAEHAVSNLLILLSCDNALQAGSQLTHLIGRIAEASDSEDVRRATFNFEDTHLLQLSLLRPVCADLDTLMQLVVEHDLLNKLLSLQLFSELPGAATALTCRMIVGVLQMRLATAQLRGA